jgi:hypothetical protein
MEEQKKSYKINRRRLWQRGIFGAVLSLLGSKASPAAQSYKVTKKQAGYVLRDKGATQTCAQCLYFISPDDCVLVQGPVSPEGWCTYYGD